MASPPVRTAHRHWWLIVFSLLAIVLLSAWQFVQWSRTQALRTRETQAHALLSLHDLPAARRMIVPWVATDAGSSQAWHAKAQLEWLEAKVDDSRASLKKARGLGASGPAIERLEALLLAREGQAIAAEPTLIRLFDQAEAPDPDVCEALASSLLNTYRLSAAMKVLERWAHDAPSDPRPYLWMTEVDERTGAGAGAVVEHLRLALQRDSARVETRVKLAEALRAAGNYDEAADGFESLAVECPERIDVRLGRGRTALARGQADQAAADFQFVLAREPDNAVALLEQSTLDLSQGRPDRALVGVEQLLTLDPFDADAHYARAAALDRLGRGTEAQSAREKTAQLRRERQALEVFRKRVNENPSDLVSRCAIARWMIDHGQGEQGLRWLRTIIAAAPEHPEANRMLADYYDTKGDSARANFHRLFVGEQPGGLPKPKRGKAFERDS
jgi:predicted Zn-dependent protease